MGLLLMTSGECWAGLRLLLLGEFVKLVPVEESGGGGRSRYRCLLGAGSAGVWATAVLTTCDMMSMFGGVHSSVRPGVELMTYLIGCLYLVLYVQWR